MWRVLRASWSPIHGAQGRLCSAINQFKLSKKVLAFYLANKTFIIIRKCAKLGICKTKYQQTVIILLGVPEVSAAGSEFYVE